MAMLQGFAGMFDLRGACNFFRCVSAVGLQLSLFLLKSCFGDHALSPPHPSDKLVVCCLHDSFRWGSCISPWPFWLCLGGLTGAGLDLRIREIVKIVAMCLAACLGERAGRTMTVTALRSWTTMRSALLLLTRSLKRRARIIYVYFMFASQGQACFVLGTVFVNCLLLNALQADASLPSSMASLRACSKEGLIKRC